MSECESYGSSEGLSSHQGNHKLPIGPTQSPLGVQECRPHLPVARSSSGPHETQSESSLHQRRLSGQSGAISSDDLTARTRHPAYPLLQASADNLPPLHYSGPLRETHISHSTPSLLMYQSDPQTPQPSQQSPSHHTVDTGDASGRERWHIWQILSKDNADALPETLV